MGERKTFLLPLLLATEAISIARGCDEREGKRESESDAGRGTQAFIPDQ